MDSEPSYLAHLGEFATLKNAIGSTTHIDDLTCRFRASNSESWRARLGHKQPAATGRFAPQT